jgi:hypothetical protein
METRDLLLTFRFDDDGIRNTIRTWFKGLNDSTWRARHKKTEEFVKKIWGRRHRTRKALECVLGAFPSNGSCGQTLNQPCSHTSNWPTRKLQCGYESKDRRLSGFNRHAHRRHHLR